MAVPFANLEIEMKKAETYPELHAICPYCDEHQEVEQIESYEDGEHECEVCHKEFKYSGVEF